MARDVLSVARVLAGTLVGDSVSPATPVDSVVSAQNFMVIAHPNFASLVVATPTELQALLHPAHPRAEIVRRAVIVTEAHSPETSALVRGAGATAILCAGTTASALLPRLEALLANDQAAEDRLVTSGTKVLTQVARRGGVKAVIAELAHRIDGWAVLLDSQGQAITTAGAGALHVQDATAVAFRRPVRVRHPGLQVHPVGSNEDLTAYLVVASHEGSMSRSRDLASQAAALLDLILRTHDHTTTERLGREVMITSLLTGSPGEAEALLRRWGVHESSLTAFILSARTKSVDLERLVARWLDELGCMHVMTGVNGGVLGFIRDDRVDEIAARVESYASDVQVSLRCGIGSSTSLDALARSASEARQAHQVAVTDARSIARYRALPTVRYVLDRLDQDSTAQIADVLDGLRDSAGEHGELTRTLHTYLAEHGSWGVTATQLGVHRQTLNSRIQRIEALTGLSMSDPDDRTAAWLALRALER
ncbi:PucR family transcriptional regulator [Glaciibacter psychrotolerans]|uniref:Purine catabolism regulator n=1 Tax=Glaciibacter psychrotolerans TaxID=670054 RepID=A0A7Z0EGE2_9MICO|nr:PucR family transcriptional regulator [Leifsonia psychrotolerans]NYJ21177.1 purine catabolism regulator [Leifsonia psychrotolerans]